MSNTDAKYTFFNIIKGQAKAHRKQTGIPLAQAQEQIARHAGFSSFHELQTVAKHNPLDHRLMAAATGVSDLSEVIEIDELYSEFQWGLEVDILPSLRASRLRKRIPASHPAGFPRSTRLH